MPFGYKPCRFLPSSAQMTPVHRARTVRRWSPRRMPRLRMSHSPPLISSPCTAAHPIRVRGLRYTISWRHPREPIHVHASFRVRLLNRCSVYEIYIIQNHKTQHETCFPQQAMPSASRTPHSRMPCPTLPPNAELTE